MEKAGCVRNLLWRLLVLLLFVGVIPAEAEESLQGPAFSDPDKGVDMPQGWVEQPIRHEEWAKDAQVGMTMDQQLYYSLLPLVQAYSRDTGVEVAVQEGRCGNTKKMLSDKSIDIGSWCCPPATSDRLPGLRFHTLGIGPIAILVNANNPIDGLTLDQVRQIFQGKLTQWSQVSDEPAIADLPIRPTVRLHCKPRPGHWRLLLDNQNLFGFNVVEAGTIPDMIVESVSGFTGAIGYETPGNLERYKSQGHLKSIKIDGVDPFDLEAMAQGRYPLYRVYNLTTWEPGHLANPKAHEVIAHLSKQIEEKGLAGNPYFIVAAPYLRQHGWRFRGDELIGGIEWSGEP